MHQPCADLWTLQIPQNSDGTLVATGEFPNGADDACLGRLFTVGKIEAKNVDPSLHQGIEPFLGIASRPYGGNYLCATKHYALPFPSQGMTAEMPLLQKYLTSTTAVKYLS
jgi:hypothetical protein